MTKSDLIRALAEKHSISISDADNIVETLFGTMSSALMANNRIELRGFGSFSVREHDGYMGRNPRTGDVVNVAPKRIPYFKAGKEISNDINNR